MMTVEEIARLRSERYRAAMEALHGDGIDKEKNDHVSDEEGQENLE